MTMKKFLARRLPLLALAALAGCLPQLPPSAPRQYNFPLIDLAADTHRQVVVDREQGQYLGHPTTTLLGDGRTIIAVYPRGHGKGPITMKRSPDGGLTWSPRLPTPANWATSQETPTIHRVSDRAGVERLILFSGLYPIRMAFSQDQGDSWTELRPIGDFGGIVAMSSLIQLADGTHLALFHDDGRFIHGRGLPGTFKVYKTISADGGLTWSAPEVIASRTDAGLCEPGALRSPDGKRLAVLLRENRRRFNSMIIFSGDEGRTWTEPRELPPSLTGDRHVARYAPDGRLVVTFRDMAPGSPFVGDWIAWVGNYEDLEAGREGLYRVRLLDNTYGADCGYPGLELLPDQTFVATSYGHWTAGEPPYVVSVRWTMEEIDRQTRARQ